LAYAQPRKLVRNADVESFNGKLRDESAARAGTDRSVAKRIKLSASVQ